MTHAILTHSYCSDFYAEHGYQFLKKVAQDFPVPPNLVIFSVMHCYEGSLPYINVLAQIAHPLVFIPKNATADANPELLHTINQIPNCNVVNPSYNKESLRDPLHCEMLIRQYITPDSPFLILDHGGYFANASEHLCRVFQQQLVGITELTANGLYKYCNKNIEKPLVTVSHLSIKTPADTEASECIVHYSDQILREEFGLKINNAGFLRVGVIGAGNLGRGIIKHLQNKDICNLHIFDQDPRRLTQFPRDGVHVCSLEHLVQQCNMVFCCTGNGALNAEVFDHLTQPLFITTVTSADDELRLPELISQGVLTEVSCNQLVKEYQTRNGICVYLLAGGESANTPFKTGMGDPTLYLFEAAHMMAGLLLLNHPHQFTDGIQALSDDDEIMIAQQWLTHFYNYK